MPHPRTEAVLRLQPLEQRGQMRQGRRQLLRLRLPGLIQVQKDQVAAPEGDRDLDQPELAGVEVLDAL